MKKEKKIKKDARKIATSAEMQKRIKKEITDPLIKWADDQYAICMEVDIRVITKRVEKALIEKMSSISSEQRASVSVKLTDADIDKVFNRAKEDYLSEKKAEIDKLFPEMAEGLMEKLL